MIQCCALAFPDQRDQRCRRLDAVVVSRSAAHWRRRYRRLTNEFVLPERVASSSADIACPESPYPRVVVLEQSVPQVYTVPTDREGRPVCTGTDDDSLQLYSIRTPSP